VVILGVAKIGQADVAVFVEQDVLGLEVAVDDFLGLGFRV